MLDQIIEWIRDPFGRKRLAERHEPIIREMIETTTQVKTTVRQLEREYPIASTISRKHGRVAVRHE